jgi:ribosomal protein S30
MGTAVASLCTGQWPLGGKGKGGERGGVNKTGDNWVKCGAVDKIVVSLSHKKRKNNNPYNKNNNEFCRRTEMARHD